MKLKRVLVQRFKKKEMGRKKIFFNKNMWIVQAGKFLLKNDLSRVYFDMKQTMRIFLSRNWKSDGYLEPSRASLMKLISKISEKLSSVNYFGKSVLLTMFDKNLRAPLTMVRLRSNLSFFKRSYLLDNVIVTVFVLIKTLF